MIEQDIHSLISIFCDADDFCNQFEPEWRKILIENKLALITNESSLKETFKSITTNSSYFSNPQKEKIKPVFQIKTFPSSLRRKYYSSSGL